MRTLTLGVLIVSGGTLAALPFRRYQAIPDASAAPAQVTGPTQSALDSPTIQPPVTIGLADNLTPTANRVEASQLVSNVIGEQPAAAPLPVASAAPREAAPRGEAPLCYEDLVQPIQPPPLIQKRWGATANGRRQQLERERVAGLVMPAMESLAVSQQEALRRVAESAATTLASTKRSETLEIDPLPQPRQAQPQQAQPQQAQSQQAQPVRHWIRQPE